MEANSLAHLAFLAKLSLTDEEKESLTRDMEDILSFVATWQETDEVAAAVTEGNAEGYREDVPEASLPREALLSAAATVTDGYITVPRVIEEA